MSASDDSLELATRAAWLSYIGGYTQTEVAKRLQVSTAKAHRLIALAREKHLVKIFIEGQPAACVEMEERILNSFSLQGCIVAPDLGTDMNFESTGSAAARFIHPVLNQCQNQIIGIGKGRSLAAMANNLPYCSNNSMRFVSVSGSLTRKLSANPQDVIHNLLEKCAGEGYLLPVPYIAKNTQEKDLMIAQQSVVQMLELARQASLFIIGIGSLEQNAHIQQTGMVTEQDLQELTQAGACGDLMGSFIDINGQVVDHPINQLALGLNMNEMCGQRVIAVAGGENKGAACLAALNSGVITDLILGEQSARQLVSLLSENKQ